MKLSIRSKLTLAALAFLGITSAGAGCGGKPEDSSAPPASEARAQALTGRELYQGLVFGVGPAAHHFDELWQRPELQAQRAKPENRRQSEQAAELLATKIAQQDPAFFDRLSRDLRSGDHLTIDRLLTATMEKTRLAAGAVREDQGQSGNVAVNAVAPQQPGVIVVVEQALDVHMYDLYYVVVYAVANGADTQGLHRDVWVDMLAQKQFDAR